MSGSDIDCFSVLGLDPEGCDAEAVQRARRRLATTAHPDRGGDAGRMVEVNAAADAALRILAERAGSAGSLRGERVGRPDAGRRPETSTNERETTGVDRPSFTVDVLPVEAFEGLLLVAAELGEVVDDDPPYLLETLLRGDGDGYGIWCCLELTPDAGSTTVSLAVDGDAGAGPVPSLMEIRDAWIDGLNRLDWSDGGPAAPRPS